MSRDRCIAIVGATGAVGHELLAVLEQRQFPLRELRLFASPRSAGVRLPFRGGELPVQALDERSFAGVDIALFSAGSALAKEWAGRAVAAGSRDWRG